MGAWLELRAVLAQETTGSAPTSGYRLWPRVAGDLRVIAAPVAGSTQSFQCCGSAKTTQPSRLNGEVAGAARTRPPRPAGRKGPVLARPLPTGSSRPISTGTGSALSPTGQRSTAGGLVVSGMGLAALAGLAAWFGGGRDLSDDEPIGTEMLISSPRRPRRRPTLVRAAGRAE